MTFTIIAGLVTVLSYFGIYAYSDGARGIIVTLFQYLYYIFAFPSFYILFMLGAVSQSALIFGMVVNSLFYGLLAERIVFITRSLRK